MTHVARRAAHVKTNRLIETSLLRRAHAGRHAAGGSGQYGVLTS